MTLIGEPQPANAPASRVAHVYKPPNHMNDKEPVVSPD